MDLDISMRTSDCPYTVHFYGAMFREGDVMICMEVMDISLDKFYARAFNNNKPIPEDVLGKVAFAVSFYIQAIWYCGMISTIYHFEFPATALSQSPSSIF